MDVVALGFFLTDPFDRVCSEWWTGTAAAGSVFVDVTGKVLGSTEEADISVGEIGKLLALVVVPLGRNSA